MPKTTKKTTTPKKTETGQDNDQLMGILSYIGPLAIIPYFLTLSQGSKFVRFHARQGLALAIVELVIGWLLGITFFLFFLSPIFGLIALVLSVMGIINVLKKQETPLPVVNQIADALKL